MCGAVGLVEVGTVVISPFVIGHGRVTGSYMLVFVGDAPSNFQMAMIVVVKRCFRVACRRCSMHLTFVCHLQSVFGRRARWKVTMGRI